MSRPAIPAKIQRAVLVEAGHRCAIPTCRATTTHIAHIVPWAKSQDHSFENLIALCPNCHSRYDQKGEIDRKSIQIYKENLALLNNRYGVIERRLFEVLARSDERVFMLGPGGDILVANALKDGLFKNENWRGQVVAVSDDDGFSKVFPAAFIFSVTDYGVDFIRRYAQGERLD